MKRVKIRDVAEQIRGVSYGPADAFDTFSDNAILLLRANNIQDSIVNYDDLVYVRACKVSQKQLLQADDILICASSGSKNLVGKAGRVIEAKGTFGAFCKVLRPNKKLINPSYFAHYFQSDFYRKTISHLAAGANINNIKNEHLDDLPINLPEISLQREITAILDTITVLRKLRQIQLDRLDQLAKSRFIEMFESGQYPQYPLIDLIEPGAGLSYGIVQPGDDGTGDMGVLRPVDLVDGHIATDAIKYIDRSIGDGYKRTELTGREILISVRGTTGITAITDARFVGMNVTRGIAVIRFDANKVNPVFLNAVINAPGSQSFIQEHTRGATLKQINLSDLRQLPIKTPPLALQNEFAAFIEELDKSKVTVQKSLEKLNFLYKALLQEYFG